MSYRKFKTTEEVAKTFTLGITQKNADNLRPSTKKTSHFTLHAALFSLLLFSSISCSKEEDQSIEVTEPLSCLYPGDLTLNQQTKNALSNYKEQPLQEKPVEDK